MTEIFLIDKNITLFLFSLLPHHWSLNYFFSFLSLQGYSFLIWLIISVVLIFFEEKKHPGISNQDKKFIFSFIFSLIVTSIVVYGIKEIIQRPRPARKIANFQFQISNCPTDYSFPSGHAANAFAASTIISFFDKKRRWIYHSVAVLVSFSRIYLNCHYLFDVIGGGIIGYFISRIILQLSSFIFPHYKI